MFPKLESTYRVLLGEAKTLSVMLVGVGGTGSALALSLARIAYHLKQKDIQLQLTLVDPDIVQPRNIGRQMFAPAECGQYKAESIAMRLNIAFGLDIIAVPESFRPELCRQLLSLSKQWGYPNGNPRLIISAVDNYLARREIAQAIEQFNGKLYGLDCGNELHSGQILIGNQSQPDQIQFDKLGLCSGIPSPYWQEPQLLKPPSPQTDPASCAELVQREEQSLIVNQQVSAIAGQYAHDFLIRRELRYMATTFTLQPPTTRTALLTRHIF